MIKMFDRGLTVVYILSLGLLLPQLVMFPTEVWGNPTKQVTFNASKYEYGAEWMEWKGTHNKTYGTYNEESRRFNVWLENKRYIDNHNQEQKHTYTLRMNHFGDMTLDEFTQAYSCHIITKYSAPPTVTAGLEASSPADGYEYTQYVPPVSSDVPMSINWRGKQAVTIVKDQGEYRCHSCYAFAAVGALESHHAIATGSRIRLSEQNVIDCSDSYGNNGCSGGNYKSAYAYIIKNGGISKQYNYRYKALQGSCRYNPYYVGATMKGVSYIKRGSEIDLMKAVGLKGPVAVAIDHKHQSFQFYGGGLYRESSPILKFQGCHNPANPVTGQLQPCNLVFSFVKIVTRLSQGCSFDCIQMSKLHKAVTRLQVIVYNLFTVATLLQPCVTCTAALMMLLN